MDLITKLKRIKDFGFFSDYSWPLANELGEFKKHNLIYGFNGSGKTNLSRLFEVLEAQQNIPYEGYENPSFTVETDDKRVVLTEANLTTAPCIRVFNKDFIEEHIQLNSSSAKSFFHLIKLDPKDKKKLDVLQVERQDLNDFRIKEEQKKESITKERFDLLAETRKVIKETLSGVSSYYTNYDVPKLERVINEIIGDTKTASILSSDKLKDEKKKIASAEPPETLDSSTIVSHNNAKAITGEIEDFLIKKVEATSKIEDFKDEQKNSWAETGYSLHKQKHLKECIYCGNQISPKRDKELSEHFNHEYLKFVGQLDTYINKLSSLKVEKVNLSKKEFIHELQSEVEGVLNEYDENCKKWNQALITLAELLAKKRSNVGKEEKLTIDLIGLEKNCETSITKLKDIIARHNQASKDHNNKRTEAAKIIEKHYASQIYKKIIVHDKNILSTKESIEDIDKTKLAEVNTKIKELENKTSGDGPAAKDINLTLAAILGRNDIQLSPEDDTSFEIKRKGKKAKSLSEGEQTAIAFAYFCGKLQEKGVEPKNTILVIDDPISSLDHHRMYAVASKIREVSSKAQQVFLLTHNYDFFREMKKWLNEKNENRLKAGKEIEGSFYFIEAGFDPTTKSRFPRLKELPDLLRKYDSDYHFNFSQMYAFSKSASTELAYSMPSITRKFLETFLSFKSPGSSGLAGLSSICDPTQQATITRYLNFSNHADYVDRLTQLDHATLSGAEDTVKLVIEVAEGSSGDKEHIKKLKKMCD